MKRMALSAAALLLAGLAGCASQSGSTGPRAPAVKLSQSSTVSKVGGTTSLRGGLPVEFRLAVENPFDHAVTLTALEVETVGESGAYVMRRVKHRFQKVIAAKSTEEIDFRAWVQPLSNDDSRNVSMPVQMRGVATFESEAGPMKRAFSDRVQ